MGDDPSSITRRQLFGGAAALGAAMFGLHTIGPVAAAAAPAADVWFTSYHRFADNVAWMISQAAKYPTLATYVASTAPRSKAEASRR